MLACVTGRRGVATAMSYILVVEDEDILRELVEIVLLEDGHTVRGATNAARALDMIVSERPSLILFDISLPDLSGGEFVERYRELPDATATLIALSAIVNLEEAAGRMGADGFLAKPFELDELLSLVNRWTA